MNKIMMMMAVAMATGVVGAATAFDRGGWKVVYDENGSKLKLTFAEKNISFDGKLSFVSNSKQWMVAESRDAVAERLALVNPEGTVLGYVSFRNQGAALEFTILHRAGANFFPGKLEFSAEADFRADSFACRTIPQSGEQVLNFADGAGDSPLNDSIFAREEDIALRLYSDKTRIATKKGGKYAVTMELDVDDPARASAMIEVDSAYYASRWAPGYHPINRKRCPKVPTGWMSWNTYFDKAGSAENLAEARIGAKYLKPFGLDIWSIESWQDNSLWLPVCNFHHHENRCYAKQFPEGMKKLADEIRALGFVPGLWMSLYGEGDENFYNAHKDLYLHDKNGNSIGNWAGRHMLDTSNPDALALIRKLARQASEEWGYEFFKFDGMGNTPLTFERPGIRACAKNPSDRKWFVDSVRAMREGIGEDKLFLGCMGDFTGMEVQFLDASRLGADVVGCYQGVGENYNQHGNSRYAQMPVKWKNVIHQAECTFAQVFINNIMFYTDPDTLLVGYSLEKHEAEVMATVIGLPGQLMFAGDRLGTLKEDRMKMIQQVLPVADIHPQNLFPYSASSMIPIWNLSVTRPFGNWHVVAFFNFTDAPRHFSVPLDSLGLDPKKPYTTFEFWSQRYDGVLDGGSFDFDAPMRSVSLYAVWEVADHPQFVGDDRHLTQGSVELKDLKWDATSNTYKVDIGVVGGFPLKFHVRVPQDFTFKSASAPAGTKAEAKLACEDLLTITVSAPESRNVTVDLAFDRK